MENPIHNIQLPPYPIAPTQRVTEDYFGITIQDDFRNLENLEDSKVTQWFREEATYTENILNRITGQEALLEKMTDYINRKSFRLQQIQITQKDEYFFIKQNADENIGRLFYRKNFESEDELLYDPKDFKPDSDKTYVISYIHPSWDSSYIVIALTPRGSEIAEMLIMDMKTQTILPQIITHCWPSNGTGVSWLPDNSGFIYLHYPEIDHQDDNFLKDMKTVLYKIGNNPKDLTVILSRETHPEFNMQPEDFPSATLLHPNDTYLHGSIRGATAYGRGLYAKVEDLKKGKLQWKKLYDEKDKISQVLFVKDEFIYSSAQDASNFQILKTKVEQADFKNPTVLIPQKEEVINNFQMTSDGIYFTTIKNGVEAKLYFFKDGKEQEINLPKASGTISIRTKDKSQPDIWVHNTGWLNNSRRYKYLPNQQKFVLEELSPQAAYPEFEGFVVKEVLVSAHDGELIPLSIIHQKEVILDGQNPTILLGYGSYGISLKPHFNPIVLAWVEQGGIYCIPHVRGGGEKGDAWYQGGKKTNKPNTWKDLISCTEYMIEQGYTSKEKTIIRGGSAGGILVGRALTERPDLFAVVIAQVGMMNPLRSEQSPNGPNNTKEFGTVKDEVECKALIEMDSYLHIQPDTQYPATLITAGMNDPRIIAWQPGKFAAKLQKFNASDKPILFKVDYNSGHGLNNTKSQYLQQSIHRYAFALWQIGHPDYVLKDEEK